MDLTPKFSDESVGGAEWRSTRPIDRLPSMLGFSETPDMQRLRYGATSALALGSNDEGRALLSSYRQAGEQLIGISHPDGDERLEVGLIVAESLALRDAGLTSVYAQHLNNVLTYTASLDLYEAVSVISAELDQLENSTSAS